MPLLSLSVFLRSLASDRIHRCITQVCQLLVTRSHLLKHQLHLTLFLAFELWRSPLASWLHTLSWPESSKLARVIYCFRGQMCVPYHKSYSQFASAQVTHLLAQLQCPTSVSFPMFIVCFHFLPSSLAGNKRS